MIKHRINRKLFIIIIMLVIFGLFMVYSASNVVALYRYNDKAYFLKRQLIFAIIGIAIMILFIHIDIRKIYKATTYIYIAALIMLILVLIPLTSSISTGLAFGFIVYPICKLVVGNYRDVSKVMYVLSFLFLIQLICESIIGQ